MHELAPELKLQCDDEAAVVEHHKAVSFFSKDCADDTADRSSTGADRRKPMHRSSHEEKISRG
jgi:hypothetical protein